MNKKPRRNYSGEEKVAILKRHLVGKESVSDICDDINLSPNQFYRWQKEFFENGAAAFERHGKREKARIRKLSKKIDGILAWHQIPPKPSSTGYAGSCLPPYPGPYFQRRKSNDSLC